MSNHIYVLPLWLNILFCTISPAYANQAASAPNRTLKVGVAGTAPFIVNVKTKEGISLEIWQSLADLAGLDYQLIAYKDVPEALQALDSGKLDLVVGPVSITASRAMHMRFTQPYYQSSLSILSRSEKPGLWQRIKPLFRPSFFEAMGGFFMILFIVGLLLWLAERKRNPEQFPPDPLPGIGNGMWCAIVTMTTTGYGDRAPITFWGRLVASFWMIFCIASATTLVAGISSTLTLTGLQSSNITRADQLNNKPVAVIQGSPAEYFTKLHGGKVVYVNTLQQGYILLKNKQVDAVVFDRPQLLYFLELHHDDGVSVSPYEYDHNGYGFALPLQTSLLHKLNVNLLQLEELGRVNRIINAWLGEGEE